MVTSSPKKPAKTTKPKKKATSRTKKTGSKKSNALPDTSGKQLVIVESPAKARTIKNYLDDTELYNFLKIEKNIQDIHWNDSIALFKDMNSLHIIYYEKNNSKRNNYTKRIKLTNKNHLRYTRKKRV